MSRSQPELTPAQARAWPGRSPERGRYLEALEQRQRDEMAPQIDRDQADDDMDRVRKSWWRRWHPDAADD